ncbi:formyltetrahydrofolate deformylase [Sphingomonas sp. Leaf208]|uniref:formyltetrahydrofolate deformylase n=1 Tax=Sphingomonas sp. Leaf208 TaxID=1735679 RepID=UPI0006F7484B|nr:formyltetrahydrofolate deformylase [Sphingomonas sp. Leaf208]KQM54470.1 formyltetrahydrofolate deformylase [Sphingomonas sp. Leaf208]
MLPTYILTIRCADRRGIVAAVTSLLASQECSILEAHQHQDAGTGTFFMRVVFVAEGDVPPTLDRLRVEIAPVAEQFAMEASLYDTAVKPRVLIMVSKFGHCLNDLLHRWRSGQLPVEIVGVVSNHDAMRAITEWHRLPYYYLPVTKETKPQQEEEIIALIEALHVDLVVLARYMQILSPRLCEVLSGRCINIHHSFLPSFKGAKPYHQAHARGVKIIGATAHYVTTDLDEGPIIEQETRRVSHARSAEDLVTIGEEVECSVLARAMRWQVDHRVLLNGQQTIVFD